MGMGLINGRMADNMMENGMKERCMGLGHLYGRMVDSMRETSWLIRGRGME